MVKGKFQDYLPTRGNSWTYSCLHCRAHLARHEDLISKSFQGSQGRAYLFNQVMNVEYSEAKQRVLLTGIHFVADVFCACCQTMLGWKYERAFEASQRYKEGKVIVELAHLIKDNGWDWDWINPPRRSQSAFSPHSSLSKPVSVTDCPSFFQPSKTLGLGSGRLVATSVIPSHSHSAPQDNPFLQPVLLPPLDSGAGTFVAPISLSAFPSTSVQPPTVSWGFSDRQYTAVCDSARSDGSFGFDAAHFCTPEEGNSPACEIDISASATTAAAGSVSSISRPFQFAESGQNAKELDTQSPRRAAMETTDYRAASPTSHSSRLFPQIQLGGHKRRRRKRALFQRRASSSSPSRTSLLPLVSDEDSDEERANSGRMNQLELCLTPPPRLFSTLPHPKSFKDCG
ncbi:protein yippee-like 2 [Clonorchis sinensis]|uniref:Protein yippee-like 2 n=1 Tax=Clonorchis sinensis TaxID=79923 RepID=G7YVK7_CLOSI|nr:protein yippee-like 2 [Clonorchis sinensis]